MTSLTTWLSPNLMHALGWTLLNFLWQGTALAAMAAVLMSFCRRSDSLPGSRRSALFDARCSGSLVLFFAASRRIRCQRIFRNPIDDATTGRGPVFKHNLSALPRNAPFGHFALARRGVAFWSYLLRFSFSRWISTSRTGTWQTIHIAKRTRTGHVPHVATRAGHRPGHTIFRVSLA